MFVFPFTARSLDGLVPQGHSLVQQLDGARRSSWLSQGVRLLHIGCGNGGLTRWLAEQGFWVVGLDLHTNAIARARQQSVPGKRLRYVVGDIHSREVIGPFEGVVATTAEPLSHVQAAQPYVDAMARVTLPGARIIQFHPVGSEGTGSQIRTPREIVTSVSDYFSPYFECERTTETMARGSDGSRTVGLTFWLTRGKQPPAVATGRRLFFFADRAAERAAVERLFETIGRSVDIETEVERRAKLDQAHREWLTGLIGPEGEKFARRVRLVGLDRFDASASNHRGIIVLNSHFGAGRVVPLLLAHLGHEVTSLEFNPLPESMGIEASPGGILASGKIQTISLQKEFPASVLAEGRTVLRRGSVLHLAGDGKVGGATEEVPILGNSLALPMGFAFLAIATRATVLPVFALITDAGDLEIHFEPSLEPNEALPRDERMRDLLTQYVARLENRYRTHPANAPSDWDRHFLRAPAAETNTVPGFRRYETAESRWDREQHFGSITSKEIGPVIDGFFPENGRALVVGCGAGEAVHFLTQRGFRVMGIDMAPRAVARARSKYGQHADEIEFYVLDAANCPTDIGQFDAAIDLMTFSYVHRREAGAVVATFARVLGPGNKLLVLSPLGRGEKAVERERILRQRIEQRFQSDFEIVGTRLLPFGSANATDDGTGINAGARRALAFQLVRRDASLSRAGGA